MPILDWLPGGRGRAERRDVERRLAVLRGEIEAAGQAGGRESLERLRARPAELGLGQDEADLELERLEGFLDLEALKEAERSGRPLPLVETRHRAVGDDECHFAVPASRPDLPGDAGGKLFLTSRRVVYIGAAPVTISWAHVAAATRAERDLVLRARPDRHLAFRCNSYGDALCGAWVASRLLK